MQNAKDRIAEAEKTLELGFYKLAASRSYYAVFSAMRAVLALQGFDSKKHSGVIARFRQDYIKTEIFSKELSSVITRLSSVRNDSDYDDFYLISKEEVAEHLVNAEKFVDAIEEYLLKCYEQNF